MSVGPESSAGSGGGLDVRGAAEAQAREAAKAGDPYANIFLDTKPISKAERVKSPQAGVIGKLLGRINFRRKASPNTPGA